MSCLIASFKRSGGILTTSIEKAGGELRASFGLVCSSPNREYDVLWAKDGLLLNRDGNKIYITRK